MTRIFWAYAATATLGLVPYCIGLLCDKLSRRAAIGLMVVGAAVFAVGVLGCFFNYVADIYGG